MKFRLFKYNNRISNALSMAKHNPENFMIRELMPMGVKGLDLMFHGTSKG